MVDGDLRAPSGPGLPEERARRSRSTSIQLHESGSVSIGFRQQCFNFIEELGQMALHYSPHRRMIDHVVAVNYTVSEPDNPRQSVDSAGHFRGGASQTTQRFADDFELTFHRPAKLPVRLVVGKRQARAPTGDRAAGVQHIIQGQSKGVESLHVTISIISGACNV